MTYGGALHRSVTGGESLLDLAEGGRTWHTARAKPRDLVERRALFREARHAAAYRDDKACRTCPGAGGLLALAMSCASAQCAEPAIFRAIRASSG